MLAKGEEVEAEVTKEDQKMINQFGRLHLKLKDLEIEKKVYQDHLNNVTDAQSDLMLADDDIPVKYQLGECYLELPKPEVETLLEKEEQKIHNIIDDFESNITSIKKTMAELKVKLYAKFGNAINLEEE